MSEWVRHRITVWALIVFVLVITAPGWYVQTRLLIKLNQLEARVAKLEAGLPAARVERASSQAVGE